MIWRKDLFDQAGLKPPDTWEAARVAARTLKAKGHPTGIQFSHCNDANLNWRSLLFSFGGTETDPSGENPTIDSKEMREALKFSKALFDEGMTPEVFSWDDASDNRYLASGIACWVHDAISAYRTTESTNPTVFQQAQIGLEPAGPGGKRVSVSAPNAFMTVGPDGSLFVSSGFHIRQILRVSPEGSVSVVARNLGDPEGIAVSEAGDLFVAENALHRVIRIQPALTPPPASPR